MQILAKVQARPCAAARATVEGVYDQQQRDNTGGWVFGRCVCQFDRECVMLSVQHHTNNPAPTQNHTHSRQGPRLPAQGRGGRAGGGGGGGAAGEHPRDGFSPGADDGAVVARVLRFALQIAGRGQIGAAGDMGHWAGVD